MFHRLGKRKMSAPDEASQHLKELRQTVEQLREQLEEEKRSRKRVQNDKVREVKAAREKEQDTARESIEALKMKLQREKAQEMNVLQVRMTKDFKAQMKEVQRKHEEEKHRLQKEMEKERRNFREQRKDIEKEVQKQMQQSHNTEQKKSTHEMFAMASQISEMEERLKDSQAADRTKAELLRQMKAEHQAELESYSHSSRLSSRQQLVELEASRRDVKEREKEISANSERIRRLEADKDRLEEEVRRLRRAESWARTTPAVTPPSLTPSTSAGELTSPHQYTAKERDMVLKNTELSFRVRTLEEQKTELEKYKRELKELLEKANAEQKPLKEQLSKQSMRVNSLNASLHDKEKLVNKVTEDNEELRRANKELSQEQVLQKRRLNQQMNQTHTQRMEHQKMVGKYTDLQKVYKKLQARPKDLELQHRTKSRQPVEVSDLECSSSSVSLGNLDASTSSVGEEGDVEQSRAKYREMKREYVTMRDHFKKLKSSYDKLEVKYRLAEKERLALESEMSLLRSSPLNERDSPFDMTRSSIMLSDNKQCLEVLQSRVEELEAFIIEQDGISRQQKEEYGRVVEERDHLQEQLQSMGWKSEVVEERKDGEEGEEEREAGKQGEREEEEEEDRGEDRESKITASVASDKSEVSDLLQQIHLVEEGNLKASSGVKETKRTSKELDDYCKEIDETLQSIATLDEEDEEDEERIEMERTASAWKKAWETVKKCQELLSSGQDVVPELESLAGLLEEQLSNQSPLNNDTTHVGDGRTPSVQTHLLSEIGRLRDELSLKEEAVELAQEKVASLQGLVEELERQLGEERKEREELVTAWEEEVADIQSQLSQKESKLTRLQRAISQGANEHMHQQLGHQVLHCLQECKSMSSGLANSEPLLSKLSVLETLLHSLLHTVFPGMLQQQTNPLFSPSTPTKSPSLVEPPSAPSDHYPPSSPTHSPTISTTTPPISPTHLSTISTTTPPISPTHLSTISTTTPPISPTHLSTISTTTPPISPTHLSTISTTTPPISPTHSPTTEPFASPTQPLSISTTEPHTQPPTQPPALSTTAPPTQPPSTDPPSSVYATEPPLPCSSSPVPRVESQSQSEDEIVVTPLSSVSSSPTHSPTQMPQSPIHPHTPPPDVFTHPHSPPLSPPSHSPVHTHTPTVDTPPIPVEEVMVMRELVCEEITLPLSALFEATPTDPTHTEPPPSNTTSELPFKMSDSEPELHSNSSLDEQHVPISELDNPSDDSPAQSEELPTDIMHDRNEEEQLEVEDGIEQLDDPSIDTVSHTPGAEVGQDDNTSEVGPTSDAEQDDTEKSGQSQSDRWSKEGTLSPSLLYTLPPDTSAGGKTAPEPSSPLSPTFTFGKKRLRTQSMDQEEMREEAGEEEEEEEEKEEELRPREQGERVTEAPCTEDRLFVAILSYDPEAMCTTGRPEEELFFQEGAIIAVDGSINDEGFYCGCFQGKRGLVPAGFVQEMEVEDSEQRKRLLNQTLSRPHLPSFSHYTSPTSSRPASATLLSPSGSMLTHTPFLHRAPPPPDPPTAVAIETHTLDKSVVIVTWTPPIQSTTVTGYHVFVDDKLKASVKVPHTKILLSDVTEDTPVVVGVASYDRDGQQSSATAVSYNPPSPEHTQHTSPGTTTTEAQLSPSPVPPLTLSHSTQSPASPSSLPTSSPVSAPSSQSQPQPEQYRLCIVLYDYDPKKMSPSEGCHAELKVAEGNLVRCYNRAVEDDGYTMAELGESNQRGLIPTSFITEVYGPSPNDPSKYEWKSPPQHFLPTTSKMMLAMYDYNSRQDSPNRDMELELSFRNGDTITIYGGMDSDGFYTGQVGKAFGLVPSNFLQEEREEKKKAAPKTDGKEGGMETWDIPPGMWSHVNGQDLQLDALAAHARTASDTRLVKNGPTDDSASGGESLEGSREGGKRRWSHGLHRPNFKNPFTRKKSENAL